MIHRYIIAITLVLAGCTQNNTHYQFSLPDNYRQWKKPVDEVLTYTVPGHGSGARVIYANSRAYEVSKETVEDGRVHYDFPEKTVIVKEVYEDVEDVGVAEPMLTIMVKNSNDERSVSGWLYYMKKPGEDMAFVESRMCAGCHDAANEEHPYFDKNEGENFRDYLFTPF